MFLWCWACKIWISYYMMILTAKEASIMQGIMKCAIYKDVKNIVVETRDIPTISSQDILVKNLRAGICGSD